MTGGRPRPLWVALGAGGMLAGPVPALACSSCFWGDSNAFAAYLGTAALMALLPLGLVGAIGWWLHRRTRDSGDGWPSDIDAHRD